MFSQLQFNHLEVKQAKQKGWIEADVADWLIPEASAPGWLYGLVKDHADPSIWSEGSAIPLLRPVESDWLIPEEPAPGRLYGLVKDHAGPSNGSERSRIPLLRPVESAQVGYMV